MASETSNEMRRARVRHPRAQLSLADIDLHDAYGEPDALLGSIHPWAVARTHRRRACEKKTHDGRYGA